MHARPLPGQTKVHFKNLQFLAVTYDMSRVGSHVVSVRIHCTEKWRTSFHTDVLSKSK